MKTRSFGKGRRRAAEKFTARQGLWMLGIVILLSIGLVLLYVFGYLHVDAD
jgi:Na+-driven multidrug efflux pump